eukprot:1786284-Rhodomonas_salina.3
MAQRRRRGIGPVSVGPYELLYGARRFLKPRPLHLGTPGIRCTSVSTGDGVADSIGWYGKCIADSAGQYHLPRSWVLYRLSPRLVPGTDLAPTR